MFIQTAVLQDKFLQNRMKYIDTREPVLRIKERAHRESNRRAGYKEKGPFSSITVRDEGR